MRWATILGWGSLGAGIANRPMGFCPPEDTSTGQVDNRGGTLPAMNWLADAARWYGLLLLLSWGFAPLVALLCPGLPGRGAAFVRPLALLAVVYPSWLLSSLGLAPYATAGLWATLALGALVGWGIALRRGQVTRGWLGALAVVELLALAAFVAYVGLRGFTPQILNTEKPMDVAFLASGARAIALPPADPWFAGEPINYYYLGYLLHGGLARMAGVPVAVGFNLALATTCSMTIVAAFGVGSAVVFPWLRGRAAVAAGALAAVLVALAGNLAAPLALLADPAGTVAAGWWGGVGWGASRVVADADLRDPTVITEFPFFSLLLGDLHPHLMALPFFLTALGLARSLLGERARGDRGGRFSPHDLVRTVVVGAVVGALYALNSWDYPTALLVALAALWVGLRAAPASRRVAALAVLAAASLLAWAPFWAGFDPPVGQGGGEGASPLSGIPLLGRIGATVGLVTWERTSVGEFLTMFGIPYLVGLAFLAVRLGKDGVLSGLGPPSAAVVVGAVSVVAAAIVIPAPLLLVCGVPLAAAVAVLRRERAPSAGTVAVALYALGLAIVLLTEFAFLRDVFGNRMNTIFKAYYQAWVLLAVAAAVAMVLLWRAAATGGLRRGLLGAAFALALAAGAVYPILAAVQWTAVQGPANAGPRAWQGLDGMAYVGRSSPGELAALRWLAAHAQPGDVVLEAAGCAYQPIGEVPTSRVSAFTGVPTVLGWANHERQWRNGQPDLRAEIADREAAIEGMYAEPGGPEFAAYGVTLLYVGPYERDGAGRDCRIAGPYPTTGDAAFPGEGWEEVFAQGEARVFRRTAGG